MSSNLKHSIRTCICIRKNYKNGEFSTLKFGQNHCTIVQGLLPDFGVTLKIRKKSNFDRNQLKLETQHKNMYMYQEKL